MSTESGLVQFRLPRSSLWGLLLLAAALLLPRLSTLAASGVNNLTSLSLKSEWERAYLDANASRCGREMSLSSRARYARLALQLDPRHPRALANSGRVAYLLGDCVQAQTDWSAALALDPADQWTAFWRFWASGASVAQLPADLPADRLASQVYSWGWRALRVPEPQTLR